MNMGRKNNYIKKVPSRKFIDYVSGHLDYAYYHDRNFVRWMVPIVRFHGHAPHIQHIAIESQTTILVLQTPPMPIFFKHSHRKELCWFWMSLSLRFSILSRAVWFGQHENWASKGSHSNIDPRAALIIQCLGLQLGNQWQQKSAELLKVP